MKPHLKTNFTNSPAYQKILHKHLIDTISLLLDQNQEFQIVTEIKNISFNPILPLEIMENFDDMVMFVIGGYTFETAHIDNDTLSFEAGFGNDNFGSNLKIPLLALKQIMVDEYPLIINSADYVKEEPKAVKSSMEALMSNPKNRKLLKKNNKT